MKKAKEIVIVILLIWWIACGCRVTKLDHKTGDRNPTKNTVHLNKVHKGAWHAGNDLITPPGFKPVKVTVKK